VFFPLYYFADWTMLLLIPGLIFGIWAENKIRRTSRYYSRISTQGGLSGARVAQLMLRANGVDNVRVELVGNSAELSDHYDPRNHVLRLSDGVYNSTSITAVGIAAHEVGHAYQHSDLYTPLNVRNAIAPVASISSSLAIPLFLFGFFFATPALVTVGIVLYMLAVFFQLVTLPVEFNASRRALAALESGGYMTAEELVGAKQVLNAAAMTYVAAALASTLQLLRLMLLGRRRR
jgi:Zn-dependent membrane protease YugP